VYLWRIDNIFLSPDCLCKVCFMTFSFRNFSSYWRLEKLRSAAQAFVRESMPLRCGGTSCQSRRRCFDLSSSGLASADDGFAENW
jgi:hypothetical protein